MEGFGIISQFDKRAVTVPGILLVVLVLYVQKYEGQSTDTLTVNWQMKEGKQAANFHLSLLAS